jgi:hypothetical protein
LIIKRDNGHSYKEINRKIETSCESAQIDREKLLNEIHFIVTDEQG